MALCPWGELPTDRESISAYSWAFSFIFSCSGFLLCRISGHHVPRRGSVCRLLVSVVMQTFRIASFRQFVFQHGNRNSSGCWKMEVVNLSCQFSAFFGIHFSIMVTNQLQRHLELSLLHSHPHFSFLSSCFISPSCGLSMAVDHNGAIALSQITGMMLLGYPKEQSLVGLCVILLYLRSSS